MEILNTYTKLPDWAIMPIIILGIIVVFSAMALCVEIAERSGWIKVLICAITCIISVLGILRLCQQEVTRYEVILTDMKYVELIEQYEVVGTRGQIIIVEEKGE